MEIYIFNERSTVFYFGVYLRKYLFNSKYLSKYDFDWEYNKNLANPKYIYGNPNGSYPDLL